ncbi:bifunctional DNA primase/polymerase [Streptomyces sp. NPDC012769]|uniref:bifunctional DNA primase/polymerase n=1 Tax=Streptomyces sp. NPDC012769 TaxID=3364848 RepID=UPI0036AD72C9
MTLLGFAARAASRGFHIFPCNPAGTENPEKPGELIEKWPHLLRPGKPYKVKWGDVATTDMQQVVHWWQYSPNANIGIACKPSGILVVDCDVPKKPNILKGTTWEYLHERLGPLVDGADVLREMCGRFGDDYSRLERTYRVCTASMGLHLYFWWPEDVQASQASPVPGLLDIRCNGGSKGGYVLAAGSVTRKGSYIAENDLPIADAPPWLVELCREKPKPKPPKGMFSQPGHAGYSGLVESVRLAQEGNRNNCLLWAARSMCEDGATEEECIDLLVPAAMECGLDGGERQALATIRSAYRLQGAKR